MGKRILTFFLYIIFIVTAISAQEKYVQRALKYVEKGNIEKAQYYLDKVEFSETASYAADFFLAQGLIYDAEEKMDSAAIFYEKSMAKKDLKSFPNKVIVDYASYLYNSGSYEEAIGFINSAKESLSDTKYPLVLDRIEEKAFWAQENLYNYSSTLGRDSIIDVSIGSNKLVIDVPRFGAAFYKDSLVFASYTEYDKPNRTEEEAFEYNQIIQDYKRTNTDLYIASLDDEFGSRKLFAKDILTMENEGAITFNSDFTQMYYTRNLYKKGKDLYQICYARKVNDEWIDEGPLNFNSDKFNSMQPSLSPDGKGLYFVSNNPGGYGGYDIYYAEGSGNNFKRPQNLGPIINTAENEIFPYLQNDSLMIYSSNGLLGFGGYDIFWVDVKKKEQLPKNLLQPINSASDDYCIVGNRSNPEQMLFFSDRDLSAGNLALNIDREKLIAEALSFKIRLLPPGKELTPEDLQLLAAGNSLLKDKVSDYNKKWGISTDVADNSNGTNGLHQAVLDSNGNPVYDADGNPVYVDDDNVKIASDGKTLIDSNGNPLLDSNGNPILIPLGKVIVDSNGNPILGSDGKPIFVADGNVKVASDGETLVDANGNPILGVDGKPFKIPAGKAIIGSDGNLLTADLGTQSSGNDQSSDVLKGTGFGSLYFGLNSTSLSDESKKNLEMVAEYLKAKKAMKLVIAGNAGLRGNESYNLVISASRAYEALAFMSQLGIPSSSILLEANGKYFPAVKTFDIDKGIENRRVDLKAQWAEPNSGLKVNFKITKNHLEELVINLFRLYLEQHPEMREKLYLTRENDGMFRVAINNGISLPQLIKINRFGNREFLYPNEVILIKESETPIEDMKFDVLVKTLYNVKHDTDSRTVAAEFDVSVKELERVNNIKSGELVKAHTKLIIPLND